MRDRIVLKDVPATEADTITSALISNGYLLDYSACSVDTAMVASHNVYIHGASLLLTLVFIKQKTI